MSDMATSDVNRVYDISEEDFWSHLHVPECEPPAASAALSRALELARSDNGDEAYRALAEYHRLGRDDTWRRAQEQARRDKSMPAGTMRRVFAFKGDGGDLDAAGLAGPVRALTHHVIRTKDRRTAKFLADFLVMAHQNRRSLHLFRYPLHTQLGAYEQFHFFWHMHLATVHADVVDPVAVAAAMKLIVGCGRSMRQQSAEYIVHNIYTAGCYALFFLARTMRELTEADEWDRLAITMLSHDWERSFFADGGHAERNWGYGAHTIGRHTQIWNFARETGGMHGLEDRYREGLQRAYRFYAYTLDGRDFSPCLGDEGLGDLGHVLDKAIDPLNQVFPAGASRDLEVDRGRSYLMRGAQVAIMRNGPAATDAWGSFNCGEYAGWHSHQDLLDFSFRAHGKLLLEEVPRFGPYEHAMDVLWRAPEAHNQLLVDRFIYDCRPCIGEDLAWYSDDRIDYVSAFHTAYRDQQPQEHRVHHQSADLIVRRTVLFVKDPGYALVLDSVRDEHTGRFNRATTQHWHSPHGFHVLGPARARTKGRVGCLLAWAYPKTIQRIETEADFNADDVTQFHHPPHDQWHHLRARTWMDTGYDGCLGFATLLYPFKTVGECEDVSIRCLKLGGGTRYCADAFEVTTPAGRDTFVLNPELQQDLTFRNRPVTGRALVKLGNRRGSAAVGTESITGSQVGTPPVPWI